MNIQMNTVELPAWFESLAVAGLALAPVTVAVVQVLKILGARLGLPEGWGGYITLAVSAVMVMLALGAGVFDAEAEVSAALATLQSIAEATLTMLAALGWYEVGKRAKMLPPVRWRG